MSTMNSLADQYFKLERKRDFFAREKKYIAFKKTYSSKLKLPNKNTGNFWDAKFSSHEEMMLNDPMENDRNKKAFELFEKYSKVGSNTLNIGCGDGNFETLLVKSKKRFQHTASDIALKSLKNLKKRFKRFEFIKLNIVGVKNRLEQDYDMITMFEVLEHISPSDTLKVLATINKSLKKNGYFMISVPMNEGLEDMFPNNPNEHLRCYTENIIMSELKISGFKVIENHVFYAFKKYYFLKKILAKTLLKNHWKPNNILLLTQKP